LLAAANAASPALLLEAQAYIWSGGRRGWTFVEYAYGGFQPPGNAPYQTGLLHACLANKYPGEAIRVRLNGTPTDRGPADLSVGIGTKSLDLEAKKTRWNIASKVDGGYWVTKFNLKCLVTMGEQRTRCERTSGSPCIDSLVLHFTASDTGRGHALRVYVAGSKRAPGQFKPLSGGNVRIEINLQGLYLPTELSTLANGDLVVTATGLVLRRKAAPPGGGARVPKPEIREHRRPDQDTLARIMHHLDGLGPYQDLGTNAWD
jgi:hypothetical protein